MIYRHKRTGGLYRKLLESFSVERQQPSVIYVSLATGQIFDRGAQKFADNFAWVEDCQEKIELKAPHA